MNSKHGYYFLTLLILMFSGILEAQQLKTFSTIPGRTSSNQYTSRVREVGSTTWQDEFVIQTTCKPQVLADGVTDSGYFGNLNGWSASYIAFEFANTSVEVEISTKDGSPITKAVVRPAGDATVTISGGKAIVTFTKNANVNVDINGQMEDNYTGSGYAGPAVHTFSIFANPIYNAPITGKVITLQPNQDIRALNRADWDAIIFAPGVHNIGTQFEIQSNETLYIPGDAIVHGTIHPNITAHPIGWTIYGSGALSGEDLVWNGDGAIQNKCFTNSSEGARLEGFMILDPANHTYNMGNSGTTINVYKNLKIFGWRKNGDGLNAFENSDISDCFFRVQDDLFYLGTNVKIHNNTTWTDSNGAVMYLAKGDVNSYFKDIKVIYNRKMWHGWNSGVISMRNTDGNIENVLCQNITVEDPFPTVALFYGTISTTAEPTNGCVFNNIVFDNITQVASRVDGNKMDLLGTSKSIWKNITIKNCKYQGQTLTAFDANWNINTYVDQNTVKFVGGTTTNYTINASAGANGSIGPNGNVSVISGANQSFAITANSGYQVDAVTVDGTNLGAITSHAFNNVTANHTISATFKSISTGTINAFSQIEAESFSSMSGVQTQICSEGGLNVSHIENGDYIVFNNVNFDSGAVSLDARVATSTAGGSIEVRLDGIAGQLVGTCTVTSTGDFQTWITKNFAISGANGTHNLYLKFTGGTGFLFNLNWIKFNAGITTFTITASAGSNGSISPSGNVSVNSGANQSFAITANSGYQVDAVTVDGTNLGAITSHTFNNVIANHTISATFKPISTGTINAFSQIEAESYSSMLGVQTETCSEGGLNLSHIENGDYIVFNNINFDSGAVSLDARVATSTAGGSIEVRLDGIAGPLVGTCVVTNTGGFQTWITKNCAISGASGNHNLYLKFTGGTGFLLNLNWIKFNAGSGVAPNVSALTGWVSGLTNTKVSGNNRLMVVMVMGEHTADFSATGVTYGGQSMTRQTDKLYYVGGNRSYASIFTLNEAGVNSASSGTIAVSWSAIPSAGNSIYSVLLDNVDQTSPVSATANNALTGTTVTTNALSAISGNMVIMCGATENNTTITFNNSITKQFESNTSWGDGTGGNKMASGVSEIPSFSQSASGRMVLCALVVKKSSGSTTARISQSQATLSVEENLISSNKVKLYPNPVSSILTIESDSKSEKEIIVINTLGQVVFRTKSNSPNTQIDIQSLNVSGFVIVQVIEDGTVSNHKVIVK
jgi:hypothetical protein